MIEKLSRLALAFIALSLLAGVPAARAEDGRTLFLRLLNVPAETPDAAFRESLRGQPAQRPKLEWEILADGSARYGDSKVGLIIRNPCPDGTVHTPLALPGRR